MTGDRVISFTPDSEEDFPQFAPNFTVYLLPSDVVCLYSEDRKFFLHGKLYCDLVAAVGKGGKTFRQLVSLLARNFPSDKIHEALQRLLDRRFISTSITLRRRCYGSVLGEPWAVARHRRGQSSKLPGAHSINSRSGCR